MTKNIYFLIYEVNKMMLQEIDKKEVFINEGGN